MSIRRAAHAVYDTKYHLVWAPKYRKWVKREDIRDKAREIFEKFPEVKKELWGGEFWEDGYFARTVGDKVTADLIKRYIKYHRDEIHGKQLKLF
jgi:putative transposase